MQSGVSSFYDVDAGQHDPDYPVIWTRLSLPAHSQSCQFQHCVAITNAIRNCLRVYLRQYTEFYVLRIWRRHPADGTSEVHYDD